MVKMSNYSMEDTPFYHRMGQIIWAQEVGDDWDSDQMRICECWLMQLLIHSECLFMASKLFKHKI